MKPTRARGTGSHERIRDRADAEHAAKLASIAARLANGTYLVNKDELALRLFADELARRP